MYLTNSRQAITSFSNSELEPEVAVAEKKAGNYSAHPTVKDIILAIDEILDSTLKFDCETKLSLYAEVVTDDY